MGSPAAVSGPDLSLGVNLSELPEARPFLGHVGEEAVMLVRRGAEVFAVSATCSHYSGPLAEGLVVGETVRCPWHHACFSLRTGEALRAPALNPIACWSVDLRDGRATVRGKVSPPSPPAPAAAPDAGVNGIVIVGAGAAGHAAAEMLRREGYRGKLTLVGADQSPPVDRPNLSKDYLAGNAPGEWIPLRPPEFYREQQIDLLLRKIVSRLDIAQKSLVLVDGTVLRYGACLLATGPDPVRLAVPGGDLPHVHALRSLADSRAIIAKAKTAKRAVVVGTSFIGLEVAASLRTRGLDVTVIGPHRVPLEPVLGAEVGRFIRAVHESHGVTFRMEQTATAVSASHVILASGEQIPAELVVTGIGVRPATALAQAAGLRVEDGLVVDAFLETSAPGVFAAGDIARWPDARFGGSLRVEHWVVAQRQGQVAARNLLGKREKLDLVPFFWSAHFDVTVGYVGHARKWDTATVDGSLEKRDCAIHYRANGRTLAVATIGRDLESLRAELSFEQDRSG